MNRETDFVPVSTVQNPAATSKAKSPIIVARATGNSSDGMDNFALLDGFEDPDLWENAVLNMHRYARTDETLTKILRGAYLDDDLPGSFSRYEKSSAPAAIERLLSQLGVEKDAAIADVGCGRGHAVYALHKRGYRNLAAMDPNNRWYSGTGYLKSLTDHSIEIVNDLERWRGMVAQFDAVISTATIHHWQHIPRIAIDTRRVMKPGAYWLAISEFCANGSREFLDLMNNHGTASRCKSYEWAYPAQVYVDLLQSVGFSLRAVIPHFYNANEFIGWSLPLPKDLDPQALSAWVDDHLLSANGTVEAFWNEVDYFRRSDVGRARFTFPQVMVFQRVAPGGAYSFG